MKFEIFFDQQIICLKLINIATTLQQESLSKYHMILPSQTLLITSLKTKKIVYATS